ncbi:MAG: hypothetical protein LBR73_03540 [Oscillospiraceae bacterium]|jgi:hypothetical protein|nr:hypothetical protein [Oscillospiraceae bacterium]
MKKTLDKCFPVCYNKQDNQTEDTISMRTAGSFVVLINGIIIIIDDGAVKRCA